MMTLARKVFASIFVCAALGVAATNNHFGGHMLEIKFDIGGNIVETAKSSGAPKYSVRNIAGLVSYDLVGPRDDIPLRYSRPGYEIVVAPIYAFTLYADKDVSSDVVVETAALQLSATRIKSHEEGKRFVENLISQFQKGKWVRRIHELCPAVSGRSSFLNENNETEQILGCPLDPNYRLSMPDWVHMMGMGQHYTWTGDGVLATLKIGFRDSPRGITYSLDLEFEDLGTKRRREDAYRLQTLAEGDANGRHSTASEAKDIAKTLARIKVLEEMAVRRGDSVVAR